jgi:uncharacterized DUF497 family protein
MRFVYIIWDDDNEEHIAEHGLDPEDVEFVLENADSDSFSNSSGRPCCFGYTLDGDYIIVIYDELDEDTIYPVTAYEVPRRTKDT